MKHVLILLALSSRALAGPPESSHFDVEGFVATPTGVWAIGADDCDEGGRLPAQYWLGGVRPAGDAPTKPSPSNTATSGDTIFTVGSGGSIRESRDAGKTWTANKSGTHRDLHAVWMRSPTEVYAVGDHGTLLVGPAWKPIKLDAAIDLRGIWGAGSDIYAIGASTFASHDGGKSWKVLPQYIGAIGGVSDTEVYADGWGGIQVTRDHAKTWERVFIAGRKCRM
jgi:photosystem II stability/assembly factor-like uncharacterized protein